MMSDSGPWLIAVNVAIHRSPAKESPIMFQIDRPIATSLVAIAASCLSSGLTFARDPGPSHVVSSTEDTAVYHAELGVSLDGTHIIAILPGSPAAKAGLRVGDEIRRLGGERVSTAQELQTAIAAQRPNSVADMVIERGDHRQIVKMWMVPDAATPRGRVRSSRAAQSPSAHQSNYRPEIDQLNRATVRSHEVAGSISDEDYVNSGLDSARRYVDPNSDVISRSKRGERSLDRAQRDFDRNTNRLEEKAGSPEDLDKPLRAEPPGYHVVEPGDLSGPRMNQTDRGPEQYYGRPGASQSERGDYPIPGDKGGISRDRRQATADDALTPDRAGRTSAEDRTTRLVDEFSTHVDRQNGRPDPISGENDPRVHPQRPYTRPAAPGRPWHPDAAGGGTAFPPRYPNRGINPPNEGTNLRYPRDIYDSMNHETRDRPRPRYDRDDD
jgi:hypothetical protein